MAGSSGRRQRQRGTIDELPSGAFRVRVYAGRDPVSRRRLDLTEVVPAGPKAAKEAEKLRTRLLNQVDEKRNPRSRATVGQLVDRWLEVHDGDRSTVRAYESKVRIHIRPLLGDLTLTRLDTEVLDSFYAELRRCREHCNGQPQTQHRTPGPHECDEHTSAACSTPDPDGCLACRRMCKPHVCKGLGNSTMRQIHWILSGALDRAVTWRWISVNPAEHAHKPSLPHPDPRPPTAEEAASLVEQAWAMDADWGAFVWTKMTIGARRGEMCGLRWNHVDLDKSMLTIRRTVYVDDNSEIREKDTKTHQQRRIVADPETVQVLTDLQERARSRCAQLGYALPKDAYVFSPMPEGATPLRPDTATQRYKRMAVRLSIDTTLKNLRHYSATELIHAGVDARIVAGRLGHGGGGSTTLRVYTAWSAEADQRAAGTVTGRMPPRPSGASESSSSPKPIVNEGHPVYRRISAALSGAIESGVLQPGDRLPSEKALARRYGVARSTAHRAIRTLVDDSLAEVRTGAGTYVLARAPDLLPSTMCDLPG